MLQQTRAEEEGEEQASEKDVPNWATGMRVTRKLNILKAGTK